MSKSILFSITFVFIALSFFSGSLAVAAGPAAHLAVVSGNQQTGGVVGTKLPKPLVVVVTDKAGSIVPGARVSWQVATGGGSLVSAVTTSNASGQTSNTLTLGTTSGANKIYAQLPNGSTAIFGAVAAPGTAVSLSAEGGNWQTATVGTRLPVALQVYCRDRYGNAAISTQVDWTVESGDGSIPEASRFTNDGYSSSSLILGKTPGQNEVAASIDGTNISFTFKATAVAGPPALVTLVSGNDQEGALSSELAAPFTIAVQDSYGNPSVGTQIKWTALTAGDSFPSASTVTGSSGQAAATLTLGATLGLHNAVATVTGTGLQQSFLATGGVNAVITMQHIADVNPAALRPGFLGLSYGKDWLAEPLFDPNNINMVTLFRNLGPGILRIVAERPFKPIIFDQNGPGHKYGVVAEADLARLAAFVKAANWKILYGIALVGNTPTCSAGSTNCAAAEAAAVAKEFGSSLYGFEIGNEPDNYTNAIYGSPIRPEIPDYNFDDFISDTPVYADGALLPSWPAYADAIEAAVPNAPLTGPAAGFGWNLQFAASKYASQVFLLTRHYYKLATTSSTMADLLAPDKTVQQQFPREAAAAAAANIPAAYRVSECNSDAFREEGVTNGFGASLWMLDFLFANAIYGSSGVNVHGGENNPASFSPLRDNGTDIVSVGPDYYGLFAYSLISNGGTILGSQVTPAMPNLSIYAVQQPNGTTDVILSNKDPDKDITLSVARPGSTAEATSYLMTAPSMTATSGFELGGSPINVDGSWNPVSNPSWPVVGKSAIITVPAGSAQVLHMRG